jgi:hypothetical protein
MKELEWEEYREVTEARAIRERGEKIKSESERIQKEANGRYRISAL